MFVFYYQTISNNPYLSTDIYGFAGDIPFPANDSSPPAVIA